MDPLLHPVEARVLGALLEKDVTTPEYYPLTLNALVNACNQKSNRDPVVAYDDDTVHDALESLRAKGLATLVMGGSNRVPKHAHRFSEKLNLGRRDHALLCELLLRGPQTLGELRSRAARMYEFSDLDEVEACVRGLMERDPDPLVTRLPQLPGTKEPRFAHLLCGEPVITEVHTAGEAAALGEHAAAPGRLEKLEAEVNALRAQLDDLKSQMETFRRQFE